MAEEVDNKEIIEEETPDEERLDEFGQSDWAPPPGAGSTIPFYPTGVLGRFFARFFATKAQPYVAAAAKGEIKPYKLAGDTHIQADTVKPDTSIGGFSRSATPAVVIPQFEVNRRNRYRDYDLMDQYPEVGAAFDIYSDDSTQRTAEGERWSIEHTNELVVTEVKDLFERIKFARIYWDIVRNTVKYGDCFIELVMDVNDPREGIQRVKILNPNYVLRVENDYGYLTDFLQEIPDKSDWTAFGGQGTAYRGAQYISLDKNQIVQFRLFTSDPNYYPYGKSIAALAIRVFRSLRMMEEAMVIYRLSRAPERRVFYIDIGNLPTTKAEMYVERLKQKFKKEKFYGGTAPGTVDERYNPLSIDEDFFVPTRTGSNTRIETLPPAQNLGEVDDVKYFRDKLLAILKVPKDYIVEKDKSPERKANLSQLDVKFARTILRVQQMVEVGMEKVAKRHLRLKGYPEDVIKEMRITLPDPSDMFTKRMLDLNHAKATVVGAVMQLGLFPKEYLYKEFYNLSDEKINEIMNQVKEEQQEMMQQQDTQGGVGMPGGAPMGGPPAGPVGPGGPPQPTPPGTEGQENIPPTAAVESKQLHNVEKVVKTLVSEDLDKDRLRVLTKLLTNKD